MEELQQFLLDSINIAIDERLRELQYDITLQGKVISMNEDRTKCTIELFGQRAEAEITHGVIVVPNDMVLIKMPAGDYNNKLIVGKVGTSAFGGSGPGGSYLSTDFDHVDLKNSGTMSHVELDSAMSEMYTSLRFEGVATEKVSLNSSIVLTAPFTLSYWIKPARMNAYFPINGTDVTVTPIRHITDTQFSIGGATPFVISEGIISNQWNNITLVKNVSNEISFYKNGRLVYEGTHTGNLSFNQIGGTTVGSGWSEYEGNIRQIKVWNTNLSVEAIQYELNSNDMMMLTGNAVQHWKIGEAQGTAIYNSISGNDGVVTLAYWQGPGTNLETSNLPLNIKIGREGIMATKGADTMFWLKDTGDAEFAGELKAATGNFIGDVTIGTGNNIFKASSDGIQLGDTLFANAPFSVDMTGKLTANNAVITGDINITSGNITWGALDDLPNATDLGAVPNNNPQAVFDALTNSGAIKGLFYDSVGAALYVNADYINAGTLVVGTGGIAMQGNISWGVGNGLVTPPPAPTAGEIGAVTSAELVDILNSYSTKLEVPDLVGIAGYLTDSQLTTVLGDDYVITGKVLANNIAAGTLAADVMFGRLIGADEIDVINLVAKHFATNTTGPRILINPAPGGGEDPVNDIEFWQNTSTMAAKINYYDVEGGPGLSGTGLKIQTFGSFVLKLESNTNMSLSATNIWTYGNLQVTAGDIYMSSGRSIRFFDDNSVLSSAILKFG